MSPTLLHYLSVLIICNYTLDCSQNSAKVGLGEDWSWRPWKSLQCESFIRIRQARPCSRSGLSSSHVELTLSVCVCLRGLLARPGWLQEQTDHHLTLCLYEYHVNFLAIIWARLYWGLIRFRLLNIRIIILVSLNKMLDLSNNYFKLLWRVPIVVNLQLTLCWGAWGP